MADLQSKSFMSNTMSWAKPKNLYKNDHSFSWIYCMRNSYFPTHISSYGPSIDSYWYKEEITS